MRRQTAGKKSRKKLNKFFVRGLLMLVFLYAVVSVVSLRMQINEAQKQLDLLNEQLSARQVENSRLDELLGADEQSLIEETARDKLGLVYPDERIYIDIS